MRALARHSLAIVLMGWSLGFGLPGGLPGAERPNVLWITVEDMSPTLGCWGDHYATTPNIDALALESVRYTRAFATAPVCSPVRSCLITGCYATSLGTQRLRSQFPISADLRGYPARLREAGYYCTNNVKTDYNTANEPAIIAASWDECSKTAHWRNRPAGRPFFAIFNDMTTHQSRTMVMPYEWFEANVQQRLSDAQIHDPAKAPVPPYYPDTPVVRKTIARYYDCVSVMDQNVGRILKQLADDSLADDTIVFFYSDHGSGMPRHKRALLDSGMHVPLLIRFPAKYQHLAPAKPGESVDRLVSFVDFPATLLSLCGIKVPDIMQGVPFLGSQSGSSRRYVFGARDRVDEAFDLARSVRSDRFLYIRNFMPHLSYNQPSFYCDQGEIRTAITNYARQNAGRLTAPQRHYAGPTRPQEELYDVQSDPANLHNLAGDPQYRMVQQEMWQALRAWIFQTRDLGFLPEEEIWARLHGKTPREIGRNPGLYPLEKLLEAASLVGGGPRCLPQLVRGLQDARPGVRYWSAVALTALGPQAARAKPVLIAALVDPHPAVRIEAAGALARTGALDKALPVLAKELESDDLDVVLHAARTIELLGTAAGEARSAMQAARKRADGAGDQRMFIRFATDAFLNSTKS